MKLLSFALTFLASNSFAGLGISVEEFGYRMEAHTLRTCALVASALNDPNFFAKFSQYKSVRPDRIIAACTAHDHTKRQPIHQVGHSKAEKVRVPYRKDNFSKHEVRKVLAGDWGLNKDKMLDFDPRKNQFREVITQLNKYDDRASRLTSHFLKLTPEEKQLLKDLELGADKSERFLNCPPGRRCSEFGKVVEPGEKWASGEQRKIAQYFENEETFGRRRYLEVTNGLRDDDYIEFRKKNPHIPFKLIRKDFLQNPIVFAKGVSRDSAHWPENVRQPTRTGRFLKGVASPATKGLPLVGVGLGIYSARAKGDTVADGVLSSLSGANETAQCASSYCESAQDLSFLLKPLNEQTQLRAFDADTNRELSRNFPMVVGLRCERKLNNLSSVNISLTVLPEHQDMEKWAQNFSVDLQTRQVTHASTESLSGTSRYEIIYENGSPRRIQSKDQLVKKYFNSTYERDYSDFKKQYPVWETPILNQSISSIRDRNISQLDTQIKHNKDAILDCCMSQTCSQFFSMPRNSSIGAISEAVK